MLWTSPLRSKWRWEILKTRVLEWLQGAQKVVLKIFSRVIFLINIRGQNLLPPSAVEVIESIRSVCLGLWELCCAPPQWYYKYDCRACGDSCLHFCLFFTAWQCGRCVNTRAFSLFSIMCLCSIHAQAKWLMAVCECSRKFANFHDVKTTHPICFNYFSHESSWSQNVVN